MFKFYLKFISYQKLRFLFLILLISFYWPLDFILSPYLNKIFVDKITIGYDFFRPLILLILVKFIFKVGEKIYTIYWSKFITKMQKDIREYLFTYTHQHSRSFFTKNLSGSITRLIFDAADKCWNSLDLFLTSTPLLINIVLTLYLTLRVNLSFGIIFLVWFIGHFAISLGLADKLIKYSQRHLTSFLELSGKVNDSLANNFLIHLFSAVNFEKKYIEKFQTIEQINKEKALKANVYLNALLNLLEIAVFIFSMLLLVHFKTKNRVTLGDFLLIYGLYNNFSTLLYSISTKIILSIQDSYSTKDALKTILSSYDINEGSNDLNFKEGKIEFKNVTFSYGKDKVLNNFNLVINPGERVGIIGSTGAGKSTIVSLLLREFDPIEGSILVDGQDIKDVTLKSLRSKISVVNQEPKCFNRTIAENISYSRNASIDEILTAAEKVQLHDFINALPNGCNFVIEESGNNLSFGERRKIELARAILDDAPILVFDELLSNIEFNDSIIQQYNKLMDSKTVLVLDSKVYSIMNLNKICVLENGQIVEEGSHQELLEKKGKYWKLLKKDFGVEG